MKLSQFKALSFDCYGTLIDWEAGILEALEPLLERSPSRRGPDQVLEDYAKVESALEDEFPSIAYSDLLQRAHRRLGQAWGAEQVGEEDRLFGQSVRNWPAFPDSREALRYLKQHFQLIILSNIDRASFTASNERLGVEFDHVFTAEDIGSYKPSLRNFHYMLEKLGEVGITNSDLLHVAQSLFHDHVPANQLGIASAWIDRRHDKSGAGATPMPDPLPRFDFRFTSLGELAAAHKAETS